MAVNLKITGSFSAGCGVRACSSMQLLTANVVRKDAAAIMFLMIFFISYQSNNSSRSVPGSSPGTLLALNIADDYFKAKRQGTVLESDVQQKDKEMYDIAIERLNALLVSENVPEIDWNDNLICGDALMVYEAYKGKFDFVVGNPPYISIHHIPVDYRDNLKNFRFSDGTSDLYIIFYEMGIQMLNEWGKLGFITPNTFLRNVSQKNFRNYLISNNLIFGVFDFKTSKLFSIAK